MKLHSDTLTIADFHDAMSATGLSARGVYLDIERPLTERKSRKRAHRFDFYLVASDGYGRRWANSGHHGAGHNKAATWREWGVLLAELFYRDPDATCDYYADARAFEVQAVRPHATPPDEARTLEDWRTMFIPKASYVDMESVAAWEELAS